MVGFYLIFNMVLFYFFWFGLPTVIAAGIYWLLLKLDDDCSAWVCSGYESLIASEFANRWLEFVAYVSIENPLGPFPAVVLTYLYVAQRAITKGHLKYAA